MWLLTGEGTMLEEPPGTGGQQVLQAAEDGEKRLRDFQRRYHHLLREQVGIMEKSLSDKEKSF